jgi:DNA-binding LacI/PurR family transcriptional regulator
MMMGLSVPRDLSVVSFVPAPMYVLGHKISRAAVPTEEVGRRAVRMLREKIRKPEKPHKPEAVAYGLVGRQTVARPPAV